ncbi:Lysine--tRNA ligase [Nymphaea thermarum]|nr:Lysine--tRNA ligase [Nymphaea thermarum]
MSTASIAVSASSLSALAEAVHTQSATNASSRQPSSHAARRATLARRRRQLYASPSQLASSEWLGGPHLSHIFVEGRRCRQRLLSQEGRAVCVPSSRLGEPSHLQPVASLCSAKSVEPFSSFHFIHRGQEGRTGFLTSVAAIASPRSPSKALGQGHDRRAARVPKKSDGQASDAWTPGNPRNPEAYVVKDQRYPDLMSNKKFRGIFQTRRMIKKITGCYKIKYHSNGYDNEPIEIDFLPLSGLEAEANLNILKDLTSEAANRYLVDACEKFDDRQSGDDEAMAFDEAFCTALDHGLPPTAGWD